MTRKLVLCLLVRLPHTTGVCTVVRSMTRSANETTAWIVPSYLWYLFARSGRSSGPSSPRQEPSSLPYAPSRYSSNRFHPALCAISPWAFTSSASKTPTQERKMLPGAAASSSAPDQIAYGGEELEEIDETNESDEERRR